MTAVAPDRDTTSDGVIGNYQHTLGKSSHNPDDTGKGNAEWDGDADTKQEVRAADLDKDLRRAGLTMLIVVRHLVLGARSGRFWWLRYVIYQGVIYHKNTGWDARAYTGANSHHEHAHVNMDFTQAADNLTDADYHFEELVAMTPDEAQMVAKAVFDMEIPGKGTFRGLVTTNDNRVGLLANSLLPEVRTLLRTVGEGVTALAAAVAELDTQDETTRAQLLEKVEVLRMEVEQVDESVVAVLGNAETPKDVVATAIRNLLGARLPEILPLLQN